jgi:hypothetical protein
LTAADWIALAGCVLTLGGLVFHAGRSDERMRAAQAENKRQCDGLGGVCRRIEARQDRRYRAVLALLNEWATEDDGKRRQISQLIRED